MLYYNIIEERVIFLEKALLVIDYTVDFVATDGKLTCGEPGQRLESTIASLIKTFIDEEQYVVFACDLHEENDPYHPESKLFPPHNIVGTSGRDLYGSIQPLYESIQARDNVYYVDKTRYSCFAGTNVAQKLRERGITEVHLVGVCTDICVLHTAVDAYNLGFSIVIHEQAVASFNEQGHVWALSHFQHTLGAIVK